MTCDQVIKANIFLNVSAGDCAPQSDGHHRLREEEGLKQIESYIYDFGLRFTNYINEMILMMIVILTR